MTVCRNYNEYIISRTWTWKKNAFLGFASDDAILKILNYILYLFYAPLRVRQRRVFSPLPQKNRIRPLAIKKNAPNRSLPPSASPRKVIDVRIFIFYEPFIIFLAMGRNILYYWSKKLVVHIWTPSFKWWGEFSEITIGDIFYRVLDFQYQSFN